MSDALPRGPFVEDIERSILKSQVIRARYAAQWLWGFWDGNTLIPSDEKYREDIQKAFEGLLKILEDK
jgi:hypothetical protein